MRLKYLTSFEHMGRARVSCVGSGCACSPLTVDAHVPTSPGARNETIWRRVGLQVVVRSQAQPQVTSRQRAHECSMRLRVLPETSSGEHKFKLSLATVELNASTCEV